MKYSLVHCYTDKNKGDAAIIIATTQMIRDIDENAEINMFSTYGLNDKRFKTDHKIIEKYADNLYPGIFHEPLAPFGLKNDKSRIVSFILVLLKSMMMLLSKNNIYLKLFLKNKEVEAFNAFLSSDIILSKGGSFLVTENSSIRQTLSLIRMLYPFVLAKRYKKRIVIFSQSLGPVEGKINQWMFEKVLSMVDTIYLRESLCLEKYKSVQIVCKNAKYKIIPDSAFYLRASDEKTPIEINTKKFNVGYTIVDHDFKYLESLEEIKRKRENYKSSIVKSIKYLLDTKDSVIHIFPQVQVDISHLGHNDMLISQEIKNTFDKSEYKERVHFYHENWTPFELRNLYKKMDIFIGTRLHSVIFSLSAGTPSINIAYHGTKSQGILASIKDYNKYVIDINTIQEDILINAIQDLIENKTIIIENLKYEMTEIKKSLKEAMHEINYN